MAKPRFTEYKHIKIGGTWRYCRAAVAVNNKVKPHIVVVGGGKSLPTARCQQQLMHSRKKRDVPFFCT